MKTYKFSIDGMEEDNFVDAETEEEAIMKIAEWSGISVWEVDKDE